MLAGSRLGWQKVGMVCGYIAKLKSGSVRCKLQRARTFLKPNACRPHIRKDEQINANLFPPYPLDLSPLFYPPTNCMNWFQRAKSPAQCCKPQVVPLQYFHPENSKIEKTHHMFQAKTVTHSIQCFWTFSPRRSEALSKIANKKISREHVFKKQSFLCHCQK